MKAALPLTLALSFAVSAPPVAAQEQTAPSGSFDVRPPAPVVFSLADAVTREAVRLAASTGEPTTSVAGNVQPAGKSGRSEWSRLRKLAPGTQVIVTVDGAAPGSRYVVSADDSGLTVLNLTDPTLPAAAARALREIASQHREYLEGAMKGGTFLIDNVRLASGSVYLADKKVADLQQVVERSAREEVAEIKTRRRGRGIWGHMGPIGGYFVGAMSGGYVFALACQAVEGRDRCDTGAGLTGIFVGGMAGLGYGFHAARRETEEVIYRAP